MPNPIYPGAIWRPGTNAGYRAGRSSMESVVCHYTVGRLAGDLSVMDRGYFSILIARDGTVYQGAEIDAVTYHAGRPYNQRGPGLECSYYDEPEGIFTPAAYEAAAQLCQWLHDEWGIPLDYYDNPSARISDWQGFISHRSVTSDADWHSDYWPELPRVSGSSSSSPAKEKHPMNEYLVKNADNGDWWYFAAFKAEPVKVDPAFVLGRAAFIPAGESNGPTILAIAEERKKALTRLSNLFPASSGTVTAAVDVNAIANAVADRLAARLQS